MLRSSFLLPLTFPTQDTSELDGDFVDLSCCSASPSCLTCWELSSTASQDGKSDSALQGAAFGCEDGTLYVFHVSPHVGQHERIRYIQEIVGSPRLTSRSHVTGLGHHPSRSVSPSSTHSNFLPFPVTQSRIVSSVSKEQVEAPKNYVDFDEEPDRLRGMLKGRGVKERQPNDPSSLNVDKGTIGRPSPSSGNNLKPVLGSGASSAKTLSGPPSPAPDVELQEAPYPCLLSLKYHILPPSFGSGHAITALRVYDNNRHIIALQQTGDIAIYATIDGSCVTSVHLDDGDIPISSVSKASPASSAIWVWKSLNIAVCGESFILIACATRDVLFSGSQHEADIDIEDQTRIVMFELRTKCKRTPNSASLEKIGDWTVAGPVEGVGLQHEGDGKLTLFHVLSSRRLVLQSLAPSVNSADSGSQEPDSSAAPPLSNPFKVLKSLSKAGAPEDAKGSFRGHFQVSEEVDIGDIPLRGRILGSRATSCGAGVRAIYWSQSELSVFEWHGHDLRHLFTQPLSGIRDVQWTNEESCTVVLPDRIETISLIEVDANGSPYAAVSDTQGLMQPLMLQSALLPPLDAYCIPSEGHVVFTRVKNRRRRLEYMSVDAGENPKPRSIWKSRIFPSAINSAIRLTSLLPIELNHIIVGYSDGLLGRTSFRCLISSQGTQASEEKSDISLSDHIHALHLVQNERTKRRFVVGGGDDGSVAIWTLDSLKLCALWTIFTTPLAQVIQLHDEEVGRLQDCILCISQDGAIAVIAVDAECQFLYLVPASVAPLRRICLGEGNMLLVYADGRARLWDTTTREFWRSMAADKADALLREGGWNHWSLETAASTSTSQVLSALPRASGVDSTATLLLDVEALLQQYGHGPHSAETKASATNLDRERPYKQQQLRSTLSSLLTFGLSEEIDAICRTKLGINASRVRVGLTSECNASSIFSEHAPHSPWCISSEASAMRASAVVAVLRALAYDDDLMQNANTVAAFYLASLAQAVGNSYRPPCLSILAERWLRTSELRHAYRVLFDAGVAQRSDAETIQMVEKWQSSLPCLQLEADRESVSSAMALFICGFIAVEKYSFLTTSSLADISRSIALYLHDDTSPYRALAIELCSRGFPVWQQYVDAVEMLRALFTLAMSSKKEAISVHNVWLLARAAILQIMSSNTPLFMTTLTIDILHPRSVQHRRSTLQLVIFLIRKKPLVLYSNLPRLVEAVVKSLDPNSTASRDAVLDSATEILGHIVQTFPTVDFHMATQRLAVGTSEGSVVMYDLKTATRLYVLEGHKKRATACSFSPDGRRLVTMSLEESVVLVWKVGSSFTSFFNPGAPPRQGHGGSEPFKRLDFNVGEEAHMTLESTLEYVRFEWPTERCVKLRIRDSTLTFST
ncbi:hypothetical protein BKA93DRAFT_436971 [Sparassis latifolia]